MQNDINDIRENLHRIIAKSNMVINSLEHNDAFNQVLSDFEEQKKRIDNNWHLISKKEDLEEMRITKLAVMSILNVLDNYRFDLKKAQEELIKLDNPKDLINKDYDNE